MALRDQLQTSIRRHPVLINAQGCPLAGDSVEKVAGLDSCVTLLLKRFVAEQFSPA
jgi:hypothetical protein